MNVLISGANGYIGHRLNAKMIQDSAVKVRLMVRNQKSITPEVAQHVDIIEADTFDTESLDRALKGIDVAYYLIHSMASGKGYREKDRKSAENFREAAIRQGVKRIIYLGGLGVKEDASEHLVSRIETGEILSARPEAIQCLWFRAGIIIGSGSASFEIIRNLVQKLPIMITPAWVQTRAQPIGVNDVVNYLFEAKDLEEEGNLVIDIGSDEMSYGDIMKTTANIMGLQRYFIPVPFLTARLSSYWLGILTPVPVSIAKALIEGLKCEVVRQNCIADVLFTFRPSPFKEVVIEALKEIEQQQVISRWSDSGSWENGKNIADAVFIDRHEAPLGAITPETMFRTFCCIGGDYGWFSYTFLWELRGLADKLLGGVGLNRGRRCHINLRVGDTIDFWKVADIEHNRRLLLVAQMKVPGKAWLEFRIENNRLIQSAYFYPDGLLGRIYWYAMIPFHYFIFGDMVRQLIKRTSEENLTKIN